MVATKDMERKALEQIKKIVADLGEDSYIGMAFDGVWELAEENIENDFGNSCAWYVRKYAELNDLLKGEIDSSNAREHRLCEVLKNTETKLDETKLELNEARKAGLEREAEMLRMKYQLEDAQHEIVRLKAKLFDLMFSGD